MQGRPTESVPTRGVISSARIPLALVDSTDKADGQTTYLATATDDPGKTNGAIRIGCGLLGPVAPLELVVGVAVVRVEARHRLRRSQLRSVEPKCQRYAN